VAVVSTDGRPGAEVDIGVPGEVGRGLGKLSVLGRCSIVLDCRRPIVGEQRSIDESLGEDKGDSDDGLRFPGLLPSSLTPESGRARPANLADPAGDPGDGNGDPGVGLSDSSLLVDISFPPTRPTGTFIPSSSSSTSAEASSRATCRSSCRRMRCLIALSSASMYT
jgi:hypothetical protein